MVRQWQDLFYDGRYSGTPMVNPDFAQLATAMGGKGLTVRSDGDEQSTTPRVAAFRGRGGIQRA
jgi:thiamine pyrophosphate-dependent acetolactate synthase large subunit-like protein